MQNMPLVSLQANSAGSVVVIFQRDCIELGVTAESSTTWKASKLDESRVPGDLVAIREETSKQR